MHPVPFRHLDRCAEEVGHAPRKASRPLGSVK